MTVHMFNLRTTIIIIHWSQEQNSIAHKLSNIYVDLCMTYMHENTCKFSMIKITLFDSLFKMMSIN